MFALKKHFITSSICHIYFTFLICGIHSLIIIRGQDAEEQQIIRYNKKSEYPKKKIELINFPTNLIKEKWTVCDETIVSKVEYIKLASYHWTRRNWTRNIFIMLIPSSTWAWINNNEKACRWVFNILMKILSLAFRWKLFSVSINNVYFFHLIKFVYRGISFNFVVSAH